MGNLKLNLRNVLLLIVMVLFWMNMGISKSSQADKSAGSSDGMLLLESFNSTGAVLESVTMHHGGMLATALNMQEGRETLQRIQRLYTWSNVELSEHHELTHPSITLSGKWNASTVANIQLTFISDRRGVTSTYLNANVYTTKGTYQSMDELQQGMRDILRFFDTFPQIDTCLQGFVSGTLNVDLQNRWIDRLSSQLQVESVEGIQLEGVISRSGYSPLIDRKIMTGNRPMNLQVATHIDRNAGRTAVTVGTPIITIEY